MAVIGGGIGGCAAALELARAGHEVVLCERSTALGGLVVSFAVGGTPLECFYHHVFPHEAEIIGLVDELGLTPKLAWLPSSVGVYAEGRVWPFTSPVDLMRFRPLPFIDRIRTGVGALRLGRVAEWEALDALPAREWLEAYTSTRAADVVWDPLLRAKFGAAAPEVPAAWMWGRFQQRAGARRGGSEKLGYLRGGFRQLFEAIDAELRRLGVDVRTNVDVRALLVDDGRSVGVATAEGDIEADAVLYTGALPGLLALVPADLHDQRWSAVGGLGVLCVVLELRRQVTDIYWTNVCDDALPFGGIIEHTNLLPPADYGGRHLMYLSRYFLADDPIATADVDAEARSWIELLADRLDGFDTDDVLAVHPFRTSYAAPLVSVGHLGRIPPLVSHLPGLYVSTTAQIYPQDRGMSEGVRTGVEAARRIDGDRSLAVGSV